MDNLGPRPPNYPPLAYCQQLLEAFESAERRGGAAGNRRHRALLLRTLSAYSDTLRAALELLDRDSPSYVAERVALQARIRRADERYTQILERRVQVQRSTPLFEPEEEEAQLAPDTPAAAPVARSRSPPPRPPPAPERTNRNQSAGSSEVRTLSGPEVRRPPPPPPLPRSSGPTSAPVVIAASPSRSSDPGEFVSPSRSPVRSPTSSASSVAYSDLFVPDPVARRALPLPPPPPPPPAPSARLGGHSTSSSAYTAGVFVVVGLPRRLGQGLLVFGAGTGPPSRQAEYRAARIELHDLSAFSSGRARLHSAVAQQLATPRADCPSGVSTKSGGAGQTLLPHPDPRFISQERQRSRTHRRLIQHSGGGASSCFPGHFREALREGQPLVIVVVLGLA